MSKEDKEKKDFRRPDPYSIDRFSRIPMWLKVLFLKFWLAGAVYYFVGWGLFINTTYGLDETLVVGVILGAIIDVFINRIIRMMSRPGLNTEKYIVVRYKGFFSFLVNILYGLLITLAVAYAYTGINLAIIAIFHLASDAIPVGVEPFGFGLLFYGFDSLSCWLRDLIAKRRKPHVA